MVASSMFNRFVWLVDTINSAGFITKHEIDRRWAKSPVNTDNEEEYENRSFHRHKEAIRELFGIEIGCDKRRGNVYYIANLTGARQSAYIRWLFQQFATANLLTEERGLQERVLFEEMPAESKYMNPIISSMRDGTIIEVTYLHEDGIISTLELMPYCLRIHDQRWYVAGKTQKNEEGIRVFAFSRIQAVRPTFKHYKFPRGWKASKWFEGYIGVEREGLPETITIRVTGKAVARLRHQPLHSTQLELPGSTDEQATFSYFLAPTPDLTERLRMFGSQLEIIAPGSLRQQFMDEAQRQAKLYGMNLHYVGEQLSLFD